MADKTPSLDDANEKLTDAYLDQLQATKKSPVIAELIAELRLMRALYCEDFAHFMIDDDDPEEWDRWVYRSGKPAWFRLPDWFIHDYPSMDPALRK
jgi:hypothetical protein